MSIKLNGGSNPTSVTYNGSTIYKVMYKTSSTATPTAVWAKPFQVRFAIPGGGTVSKYSSDVAFDSEGTRVSNVSCSIETCYAYWGDTFHVSWDDWWMPTVVDPHLIYEAGSVDIVVAGDVIVDAMSGGGGTIEPPSNWITSYGVVDYETYSITALILCPIMPPSTTTTEYNIAGKTGSYTGNVTSGTTVTHTFAPSLTTQEFVCTIKYETYGTKTEKISNPFYHSSGKPNAPTITIGNINGTGVYYSIKNNNNHPVLMEYGPEDWNGLMSEVFEANEVKTFYANAGSTNWTECYIYACAVACKKYASAETTVENPSAPITLSAPVITGSTFSDVDETAGGSTSPEDVVSLRIVNNNKYAVTAHYTVRFHERARVTETRSSTKSVPANATTWATIISRDYEYNTGAEVSCYFSHPNATSNSNTTWISLGTTEDTSDETT